MNKVVAAKTIRAKRSSEVIVPEMNGTKQQRIDSFIARQNLKTLSDQIANDSLYYINHYFAGCFQAFPDKKELQHVDKYYPYADGGPLYVDEQNSSLDKRDLTLKMEIMKKLGHRYVIIKPEMKLHEALEYLA